MKLSFLLIGILQLKMYENANILGILPVNGKSHAIMFEALFKSLAARGHHVDVVGHYPLKEQVPRYTDIAIKGGNFRESLNNVPIHLVAYRNVFSTIDLILNAGGAPMCEALLSSETVKHLKGTSKKYDLLITQILATECPLGFAHLFRIPTVGLTTSSILPWSTSFIGLPDNPSYIPNYLTSFTSKMTLMERVINTAVYVISKVEYEMFSAKQSNILAREFFGPDLPDLRDLANNVSLLLVNSHFSAHMSRPIVPNFVEVAGLHINENSTLSQYFEHSLETNLKGVIYLSFGSMLLTETLPEDKLRGLFEAFRKIPYKIMWKATRENFPKHLKIPSNIQFEPWMPQMGILCHPNVKLFVSHGGMMGTLEALYCGVPILGIPVMVDQSLNIETSVSKGVAVHVALDNITEESISEALMQLLDNPRYRRNVKIASELFKDRPASAMDTAIYWIEYVLRHNGAPHLRTVGATLPWYQYFLIDVALIFLTLTVLLVVIIYYIGSCIYYVAFKRNRKVKQC